MAAGRRAPAPGLGLDPRNAPVLRTLPGTTEAPLFLMCAISAVIGGQFISSTMEAQKTESLARHFCSLEINVQRN